MFYSQGCGGVCRGSCIGRQRATPGSRVASRACVDSGFMALPYFSRDVPASLAEIKEHLISMSGAFATQSGILPYKVNDGYRNDAIVLSFSFF